jgi:all-trans-retinol dehydrogenase (NAD+)
MLNSILPREGLTLEAIFAPIRLTLLQPLLTGSLLLAIYKPLPPSSAILSQWPIFQLLRGVQSPRLLASLGILFSIGLLRKLNKTLSRLMLNNFVSDKTWNWSREIVIITGGSSGIGALMVKMFAERDITVIILDITPPKSPVPCMLSI